MKMLHVSVFLTAHKRSYWKVMYLHLSVILFTGGVCIPACIGQGYVFPSMQWDRVVSAQGGVYPRGCLSARCPVADPGGTKGAMAL